MKLIAKIGYDEWAEDPMTFFDGHGAFRFALFHNRYDFPNTCNLSTDDFDGWDDMKLELEKQYPGKIIDSVYIYDHSGVAISRSAFGCPWDSGQIGFMIRIEELSDEYVDQFLSEYQAYINGSVYRVDLFEEDSEDFYDSMGCFYDYDEDEMIKIATEELVSPDDEIVNIQTLF